MMACLMSTNEEITLDVTGYNIDFNNELDVIIHDTIMGDLSVGPNNALNSGDTIIY